MTIETALLIASAGFQIMGGIAAKQQADANAKALRADADRAIDVSLLNTRRQRRQNRKLSDAQRAAFGAAGVQGSTGTPLTVQSEQAGQNEMEAMIILHGGQVEATRLRNAARAAKAQGKAALGGAILGAGFTILGGFGKGGPFASGGGGSKVTSLARTTRIGSPLTLPSRINRTGINLTGTFSGNIPR